MKARTSARSFLRMMSREETEAVISFLHSGEGPSRDLVRQLVDRIKLNYRTRDHHTDPLVLARCEARVEAYRYSIMTAIRCQASEDVQINAFLHGGKP
jgi:hypothetical protein